MESLIGQCWRFIATILLFVIFGLGGVVAACTILPVLYLSTGNGVIRQRRSRTFVRVSFRAFLDLMALLGPFRFDVDEYTRTRLSDLRCALIVGKHPTLLDVMVLLSYVDQANCVVKSTLWRNPFVLLGIRAANYIPNNDVDQLMSATEAALRKGETLIIFPEATRTVPGQPLRLRRGAANIALRADAQIQILHISCDPVFLSREMPWYKVPRRQPCLKIRAGDTLRARDFHRLDENRTIAARRLTDALTSELTMGESDGGAGDRAQAASH